MDSIVEVALAAKLLKLFPNTESKFLAIPVIGAAFTLDDLDFLGGEGDLSAEQLREQMARKNQFARLLNDIIADSIEYSSEDRLLWDEYRDILETAVLAKSALSDAEKRAFEEARNYLFDEKIEAGEKTQVYSAALVRYYEYKEAYESLERVYLDERMSAEHADTAAEKAAWTDQREPELLSLKDKAMQDWITLGNKDVVEKHQKTIVLLGEKEPAKRISGYLSDFEACREKDLLTNDPVGTYSTFYSPNDALDPRAEWSRVNITKAEMKSLLDGAPPSIKRKVGGNSGGIESLSVEYAKLVVMRPWFNQSVFDSRYWKLPPGDPAVSDGQLPRKGRIPAFITNMIVARKITIERLPTVKAGRGGTVSDAKAAMKRFSLLRSAMKHVKQDWRVTVAGQVKATKTTVARKRRPVSVAHRAPVARRATVRDHRKARRATPIAAKIGRAIVRAKMIGTTVRRPHLAVPARKPVVVPKPPRPKTQRIVEEVKLDGVAVLAYVCRRLPKSPNPNDGFDWF
jgi:hypothetical protein